ncbi:MAG TPA: hypothetical protein VL461_06175 [Dictyobacter sp.]|jgi:hypothetical protein|nr:hypothetical protein [Dictyobacter sp.]
MPLYIDYMEYMGVAMDAQEILQHVLSQSKLSESWNVFPLLRRKVIGGILGWIFGIIMGLGLFALIVPIMIPANYERGALAIVFSTVILLVLFFIGVGSVYLLVIDMIRLRHIRQHVIVITNTDFVKQEGKKIIQVPLEYIKYVTPRGRPPVDRTAPSEAENLNQIPNPVENLVGMLLGRGVTPNGSRQRRKRVRTPTSLAFLDTRTQSEVTVVSDEAYGDPFRIAAYLKQQSAKVQGIDLEAVGTVTEEVNS